jgi:AraC-like DNA-binding protein
MPHTLAFYLPAPDERTYLATLARRAAVVVIPCATEGATLAALSAVRAADALVMVLRDGDGRSALPLVRRVRGGFPSVPIVAYGTLSPQFARDVLEAARWGVAALALHGYDDLFGVVARVLRESTNARVVDAALAAVDVQLSAPSRRVLRYCLEHADSAPLVEEVAADLGVRRNTINSWLAADALPPASVIVSWGRVLLASRLLEDSGRPVEHIALALGFDSGTALRHMLCRYTRLRPGEIRARGGLAAVLPLFTAALGHARHELAS